VENFGVYLRLGLVNEEMTGLNIDRRDLEL
jgi:hypothetical protein